MEPRHREPCAASSVETIEPETSVNQLTLETVVNQLTKIILIDTYSEKISIELGTVGKGSNLSRKSAPAVTCIAENDCK